MCVTQRSYIYLEKLLILIKVNVLLWYKNEYENTKTVLHFLSGLFVSRLYAFLQIVLTTSNEKALAFFKHFAIN